jgi:hypothetical protein
MTFEQTPILDPRDAERILAELLQRRPAYLPHWTAKPGQRGQALLRIFARYMELLVSRLNEAPDKNLLAFLDMMGISLIPARASRAPVVFESLPNAGDGQLLAGTRLGAQVPGQPDPLAFETESSIAMAAAQVVAVRTVWPTRDASADHSMELAGGRPFTLFEPLQPVAHELYLAHDTLFALKGTATVQIEFDLATPGSEALDIVWELWDGQVWRQFRGFDAEGSPSVDGTAGLTRSGVVTLKVECGPAEKTTVHGVNAYWIRGRLNQPLPPDPARTLPLVDGIRVRSVIRKSLVPFGTILDRLGVGLVNISDANTVFLPEGLGGGATPASEADGGDGQKASFEPDPGCRDGVQPEHAFAGGTRLDTGKTFFPFGRAPSNDSAFYFSSDEVFGKPGAHVTLCFGRALTAEEEADQIPKDGNGGGEAAEPQELEAAELIWEYWNGRRWTDLAVPVDQDATHFRSGGRITFAVPPNLEETSVNGVSARWLRVRITSGSYNRLRIVELNGVKVPIIEPRPPALQGFFMGYEYRSPWERPEHSHSYNDFQIAVHSDAVRWPGNAFSPFRPVADVTPALYLGFDRPLPNDLVSLYFEIQEREAETPSLLWEAWDGDGWQELQVSDETADLRRPGMVSFIPPAVAPRPEAAVREASQQQIIVREAREAAVFQPGDQVTVEQDETSEMATVRQVEDERILLERPLGEEYGGGTVSLAALPRFGQPLDWVRARLKVDGAPAESVLQGLYLNAVWARQVQTIADEVLGSSRGEPEQAFFLTQVPVLPGEEIEVRELSGARARVELPILQEELRAQGLGDDAIRRVFDPRSGQVTEVWVRWQPRPNLFFSGPEDRHYVLERAGGRLLFGDGEYGRIPTVGPNNVHARRYQAGGGLDGNVPAGAINQLLGAAPFVQAVSNPRAAEGGADGERLEAVRRRGPQTLRHRGRSISARDYEAMAKEASPGIALARALPATTPNLRPAPGWVTVIIVPQSLDPRPQPSFGLRQQVQAHLAARAPVTLPPERIAVIGPTYLPLGLNATVVPRVLGEAGLVRGRVEQAAVRFLNPLTGGPEGRGWSFGQDAFLSDVAALLERVQGVDYVAELQLLLDDTPQGERVPVPPDRIVVAGPIRVQVRAAAG